MCFCVCVEMIGLPQIQLVRVRRIGVSGEKEFTIESQKWKARVSARRSALVVTK